MDPQEVLLPPQEMDLEPREDLEQILLKVGALTLPQEETKDLDPLPQDLLALQLDPPGELPGLQVLPNPEEDPEQNPRRIKRIKSRRKK